MILEKSIKQKSFESPFHRAIINVMYTANIFYRELSTVLKDFNISPEQYNILRILRGQYPKAISVKDITDRMLDKMSNTSRLIEKLLQKEMVSREISNDDRRKADVCITELGLRILKEADLAMKVLNERLDTLEKEEYELLNQFLDKWRPD